VGGGVILWRSVDNQWDCYFLHLLILSVFAAAMLEYNNMLHTEFIKKMWFLTILDFIEIRNASSVIYIYYY